MSAVATFYLLESSKLDELKQHAQVTVRKSLFSKKIIDHYWDYLATNVTELPGFHGSGYIYGSLLVYLDDKKGINLLKNEYSEIATELTNKRDATHFLFTHKQKNENVDKLEPSAFSLKEIQNFNREFSEDGDEETAKLTIEAIRVLRDNLKKIESDQQLIMLIVG